jgi:Osmosensitive K+ channel His kinase sensor domain/Divalent cation transporter
MVDSNATELGAAGADSARGRLKVFLGYASGVGKSFRMFDEARRRKERGQDVVVGALQPEVPPEIKSLLDFLEVAPSIDVEVFLLLTFQQSSAAIRKCASLTAWRMTAPGAMLIVGKMSTSCIGAVLFGTTAGSMLPFVLRRFGLDPASASAPFVATLVDVSGLVIYFSVANVILQGVLL